MALNGKLVGFSVLKSLKGNDCFFGWVQIPYADDDKNSLGVSCCQISAFGDDATDLREAISKGQLLNKSVRVKGNHPQYQYNGKTRTDYTKFNAVSIELDKG